MFEETVFTDWLDCKVTITTKKDMRSLYIYATENVNIRHDTWAKIGVSDDTEAEPTEKLRTIISKTHQTAIWSEEYRTLKTIDPDGESFEDNTEESGKDLYHANMPTHSLIQGAEYLNLYVDNLILFLYTRDTLMSHPNMYFSNRGCAVFLA